MLAHGARVILALAVTALLAPRRASAQGGDAAKAGHEANSLFVHSTERKEHWDKFQDEEVVEQGTDVDFFDMGTDEEVWEPKNVGATTQKTAHSGGGAAQNSGSESGSWDATLADCPPGHFRATSTSECASCVAGSVTNTLASPGATTCVACTAGRYSAASTAACTTCKAGSATNTLALTGASACVACGEGYINNASTLACTMTGPAVAVTQEVIQSSLSVATAVKQDAFKNSLVSQLMATSSGGVAISPEDIIITAYEITSAATADPIGCENSAFTTGVKDQFVAGTTTATGATTVTVTGDPQCVDQRRRLQETAAQHRRRLSSGAAVAYVAASSDPAAAAAMAATMADTATFAASLKDSINAAPGPIATITAIAESTPAIATMISYEVRIPAGSAVSAASVQATTSDSTAMAAISNAARVVSPYIANITADSVTATATTVTESESNGVDTIPAASAATAAYASFKLTLPGQITDFSGSADLERTFKTAYKKDIAAHLSITSDKVLIRGWTAGSVVIDTVTTGGVTAAQINTAFAAGTSVPFSNLGNSGLVGFPTSLTMTAALFESATAMGTGATPTPAPGTTTPDTAAPTKDGIKAGVLVAIIAGGVVFLGAVAIFVVGYKSAMKAGKPFMCFDGNQYKATTQAGEAMA